MNNARNELTIKLGGEEILLRPTFENIAAMESNLGGVNYLGWKYSRGLKKNESGGIDAASIASHEAIKSLPPMSEIAQIIYYNQAARKQDDPTQRKYSLNEIWERLLITGSASLVRTITVYLAKLTAGDKLNAIEDMSDEEKKSSMTEVNQAATM